MIKTDSHMGLEYQYILVDPSGVDLAFNIGATVKQLGSDHAAAVNFPFADLETGTPIGRVVLDGLTVIQDTEKTKNRDLFYVTNSGVAAIGQYPRTPIKWAVQGTPRLIRDGVSFFKESIIRDHTPSDIANRRSQRTAVGLLSDGTVVIVATKTLMDLGDITDVMLRLGCVDALNGDGGGSTYLWPEDTGWGRRVGAAIVVKKGVKENMRIILDAGHFPETPGKRPPDDSMREYHFNSVVADYVADELMSYENVSTLMTHDDKRDVTLDERVDRAEGWNADVFVSIHANAHGDGTKWTDATGIETFTCVNASRASTALAVSMQRNMIVLTGMEDRGVKKNDYKVLKNTTMPAVLVECGFMTNRKDLEKLKSDNYRRICAKAIVKSLVEVYGLKKKVETVKIETKGQIPVIQREISVSVNGGVFAPGYLIKDTAYVPIRMISETFGATVDWNDGNPVKISKK